MRRLLLAMSTLVISTAVGGCGSDSHTDCTHPIRRDLMQTLEKARRFSQVFVAVDTVVLDTTGGGIIGVIDKAVKSPNGYLILDARLAQHVFMFDDDGRFLRKLARHGSGPSEYRRPADVASGQDGSVYVLDATLRKVMCFDPHGNWLRDVTLAPLGIYPSGFALQRDSCFLFYCLHPDFPGKAKGKKVVSASLTENGFEFRRAFGRGEKLLKRFFFNLGAFRVDRHGRIWLGEVFTPSILLYSGDGKLIRVMREHESLLPDPLISPARLKPCRRMTEAVDVYERCTRLADIAVLHDLAVAIFFSDSRTYFVLLDECGRVIGVVSEPIPFLPSLVVGVWDARMYFSAEPVQPAAGEGAPGNPILVGYALRSQMKE